MIGRRTKGSREGLPTVAAITMARDEGAMLTRWVRYYGDQLGLDHLVVIDDNSSDGSTRDLPCSVLHIPPIKASFEEARMGMLSSLSASLLQAYDAVLFADVDEFVVADPDKYDGLLDLVADRKGKQALGVMGLNVVQLADEAPLDPAQPILGQRRAAKFMPLMCKPSLKWVPADWRWASHGIMAPYKVDPDLYMFHMKFADRDLLQAAGDRRRALVELDGRAKSSSWRLGGDEMVALLDRIAADTDPAQIEPFKPTRKALKNGVEERPAGTWRAVGAGQTVAMERRMVVGIPERFHGLL